MTPNPSSELTSSGWLCQLPAAAHVKRSAQMPRGPWNALLSSRPEPELMVLEKAYEGASRIPGQEQDELAAASMVLLHHP